MKASKDNPKDDKVRVYEIARKYSLSSAECLAYIKESGLLDIKSYMSALTLEEAAYFDRWWEMENKGPVVKAEPEKKKEEKKTKTLKGKSKETSPATKETSEKKEIEKKVQKKVVKKELEESKEEAVATREKDTKLKAEKAVTIEKKKEENLQADTAVKEKTVHPSVTSHEIKTEKSEVITVTQEIQKKERKYKSVSLPKPDEEATASFSIPAEEVTAKPLITTSYISEEKINEVVQVEEKIEDKEKTAETIAKLSETTPVVPEVAETDVADSDEEDESRRGTTGLRRKKKKKIKIDHQTVEDSVKRTLAEISGFGIERFRYKKKRKPKEELQEGEDQETSRKQALVETFMSAKDLSGLLEVKPEQLMQKLDEMGISVSLNQPLDYDTIVMLGDEFETDIEIVKKNETEEKVEYEIRPPVVTVMGHVDHGKTSILDFIRKANVVATEAGGITQHIGAYIVSMPDKRSITFIDTPGHEAFTAMRARGAQVTDIVVLVIASDERVMPQTIEAINHAKAANVPVIVAINKCDLPTANPQKIKMDISQYGVLLEEYGGDVIAVEVSAKTGSGINDLLERILLLSEMLELKSPKNSSPYGTVLEAKIDKGVGVIITVLVKAGVMKIGQNYIVGVHDGTIRSMLDDKGNQIKSATPSVPVAVIGTNGMPKVGDNLEVIEDKREAHRIAEERKIAVRKRELTIFEDSITMENIYDKLLEDEKEKFNIILKVDVQGSLEALSDAIFKLDKEERIQFIHRAVGPISESDVLLAKSSNAIIIGYNIRPSGKIAKMAETEKVDIRLYTIIYELLENLERALSGRLEVSEREEIHGRAEVRAIFRIGRIGSIAGCFVVDGKVLRKDRLRIIRDGKVIYTGKMRSLRHVKDDVSEIAKGFECGISIEDYNDIKEGDVLEAFDIITESQSNDF
ncbi:MAG: translation initiation factor IF-2 [Candidatus Coatesbacteria bacterium]|nr:translation initiation factor IF-2 [Candidatus Coatesbacteria bacterium]